MPPLTSSRPDLLVVGSGLGGLCAAALAARHGLEVLVLEAHVSPGGAAHGFHRRGFRFESGPSLWSGLGSWPSTSPLAQVLHAVGESVPTHQDRDWGLLLPEGRFRLGVGTDPFLALLRQIRGKGAVTQWQQLLAHLAPRCEALRTLPLLALRPGIGTALSLGGSGIPLLRCLPRLAGLGGAFGPLVRRHLSDPFLLHWVDLLCFLISGLDMDHTSAAAMVMLFGEWFEADAHLDLPIGGSSAVVEALVRGLRRHGGALRTRSPVGRILLDGDRACGVQLEDGEVLHARRGVIANVSPWDLPALLPEDGPARRWRRRQAATPACGSFLHWHLALRGDDLPSLPVHHVQVADWGQGVPAAGNVVVFSMPSLRDASLAPPGHQVLHAYTPASEPWELWQGLERGTAAYEELKRRRCSLFQRSFSRILPDWRERLVLELQGTPLTHRHYLRIQRGSYGPAWPADRRRFPGGGTPIAGLVLCGAGVFPGIGVPAVALSGALAAHRFVSPARQHALLRETGLIGV